MLPRRVRGRCLEWHYAAGLAASARAAGEAPRWLTADSGHPGDAPMPAHYRHVFAQMQDFNRDVQRYAAQIARDAVSLLDGATPAPAAATARELDALFAASDWLAVHFRRRVRISLLCTHALAAAMGLAFILYSDVQANRIYVAIFLLVFVLGLAIRWVGERREWQRKGRVPLHTMRESIDYGFSEAQTVYGKIGVKCWICKKEADNN